MIIQDARQIKEFINIPPQVDEQCDLCVKTANHYVLTIQDVELKLCNDCFGYVISIEAMLHLSN